MNLRVVTYMAPSIPLEIYRHLCDYVAQRLGVTATLVSDTRGSGPRAGSDNPFSRAEADVGFMCAPCFVALAQPEPPPSFVRAVMEKPTGLDG